MYAVLSKYTVIHVHQRPTKWVILQKQYAGRDMRRGKDCCLRWPSSALFIELYFHPLVFSFRFSSRENACDICSLQAVSVLGLGPRKLPDRSPSRDSARPGRSRSATERRAFERTLGLAP